MSEMTGGPSDFTGGVGNATPGRTAAGGARPMTRAKMARESRRAAQFAKFRLVELNLVPLVDTLVSIVFFALATATAGVLAPVTPGVRLPVSQVGDAAQMEITLGVGGRQVTIDGVAVMTTDAAASAASNDPNQPLKVPLLYAVLKQRADSIRDAHPGDTLALRTTPLAIQSDSTIRYILLSRFLQTARLAGFHTLSLQIRRAGVEGS